jgi:mono/diheme cytochrome c family protein
MSDAVSPAPIVEQPAETQAGSHPVPVWLILASFLLLYWGMVYFDQRGGWFAVQVYAPYRSLTELQVYQPTAAGGAERGKPIYDNVCALCHNTDGMGKPGQAPPFAKSEWAQGDPGRMIRIPLSGLSGPITVNGQEWNLAMPAMGAALSDEDLAAVLTYIRQSWGNKASEITPEQVKAVRGQVSNRTQPWSVTELNALP